MRMISVDIPQDTFTSMHFCTDSQMEAEIWRYLSKSMPSYIQYL